MKFDRKQHYSLRKYKSVGLASAVVGLSMLGATGVLNDVPVVGDLFGVKEVSARTWKLGEQLTVPSYTSGGPSLGSLGISWNGGAWTLVSSLPPGYTINSVSESGVSLSYKEPETSTGSSLDFFGSSNSNTTPSNPVPAPERGDKDITVRYNVIGRSSSETYSFDAVRVHATRSSNGWSYTISAPEGFVLAKNNQITSVEYSSTEPNNIIVVDIKKNIIYQGDDSFELGYVNKSRRSDKIYVTKGTKPTVTRTPIDFTTRYVKDLARVKGAENITETEGRAGEIVRTVRHTVDSETGVVSDLPAEETRTEPTNKVVKVAAKDKVETIQRGRQTVENQNQINKINRTNGFLFYPNLSASTTCQIEFRT